jgi:hypothetical protein
MNMLEKHTFSWIMYIDAGILVSVLFIVMVFCLRIGSFIGKWKRMGVEHHDNSANNTIHGALLGLLAFLLAITFSMGGVRYENRRAANVKEANDISTTILRADFYPDSMRAIFREDMKQYLQARIDILYAAYDEQEKINEAERKSLYYQQKLWDEAVAYSKKDPTPIIWNNVPFALTTMFESARANTFQELMRVPSSIVVMLFLLSWAVAFFIGYASVTKGKFDWLIGVGFCLMSSLVVYTILDMDRPRRGFIQLDTCHESILFLMNQYFGNTP